MSGQENLAKDRVAGRGRRTGAAVAGDDGARRSADTATTLSEPPLRMVFMYMPNGVRAGLLDAGGRWRGLRVHAASASRSRASRASSCCWRISGTPRPSGATATGRKCRPGSPAATWSAPRATIWIRAAPRWISSRRSGSATAPCCRASSWASKRRAPASIRRAAASRACTGRFISWRDPHTPVPKEIVPQLAFDRLFRSNKAPVVSSVNPDDPSLITSLQRDDTSVLDLVREQAKPPAQESAARPIACGWMSTSNRCARWSSGCKPRMKPQKRWINQGKFPLERPGPGIPASRPEHIRLMMDILILALWSDTTRISAFMTADAQTNEDYSFASGRQGRLPFDFAPRRRARAQEAVREAASPGMWSRLRTS